MGKAGLYFAILPSVRKWKITTGAFHTPGKHENEVRVWFQEAFLSHIHGGLNFLGSRTP